MDTLIIDKVSEGVGIKKHQVASVVELLDGGATIPFISRYRKEATGSLDEVEINSISLELIRIKDLISRKETILKSIEEQEKLTPELKSKIERCWNSQDLEDIYLPFKPKRKTRASMAREKGLEPLAKLIMAQRDNSLEISAGPFIKDEVTNLEEALAGARDIIAEWINENADSRNSIRTLFKREATLAATVVKAKKEEADKYRDYFEFSESLKDIPSHRILAIRRGESEGFLRSSISISNEEGEFRLEKQFLKSNNEASAQVKLAIEDCLKRLLLPSIETEFRLIAKDKADEEAIGVFAENLRQLLLSAPLGQVPVLGLDPGFKSGCKLVCLNERGDLVYNSTIFPHPPQNKKFEAEEEVKLLLDKYNIGAVAVGNGTAGRETLAFIKGLIPKGTNVEAYLVNEAGASIYSASEVARNEFPDYDLTVRGAVSIGRRLMDPLAELVKIDAKSIGVGQYQHDVNQEKLKRTLDTVVESAVNNVGVNLNTASEHLLRYVSGIGPTLAKRIAAYRKENGDFKSRKSLMDVAGLGAKAFEQGAGFLRIKNAANPLDDSAVHPERYKLVKEMAKTIKAPVDDLIKNPFLRQKINPQDFVNNEVGLPTINDILQELAKPGLDPRGKAETFSFAEGIETIGQLREGMVLPGVVTNLAKFGAFVDIGIKENGLLHISQIANRFIKDPAEVLKLDQKVKVRVMSVEIDRKRIQLSMKDV
jgi:uncharacterized protein